MDPRSVTLWIGSPPPAEGWRQLARAGLHLVMVPVSTQAALTESDARLVVVTGSAGDGLAARVAGILRFAPGVWVVALVSSANDVAVALEAGAHDAAVAPIASETLVRHLLAWRDAAAASCSRAAALGPLLGRTRELGASLSAMELELRRLRDLSDLDDVTGLANGRLLGFGLRQALAHACRYGDPISLLALGLDGFQGIEPPPGRPAERLLRHAADAIRASVRACDVAGRIDAGRFAVALPSTALHAARQVADRVRARISLVHLPSNWPATVTASVGIATFSPGGRTAAPVPDAQDVLSRAVRALESAERRGGDRVVVGLSEDGDVTEVRRCPPGRPS